MDNMTSEGGMESDKARQIKRLMHKNFDTVVINIPLSSLQGKFNFMKNCPLSGN